VTAGPPNGAGRRASGKPSVTGRRFVAAARDPRVGGKQPWHAATYPSILALVWRLGGTGEKPAAVFAEGRALAEAQR